MSSVMPAEGSPFWKDPSFLLAAVPTIVAVLAAFGLISSDQVDTVNQLVAEVVRNGFLLVMGVVGLWKYFGKQEKVEVEKLALRREEVKLEVEQLRVEQLRMNLKA